MAQHPDAAIIGGGIIGLTSALFLARVGLTVEVFDQSDLGREASWAGAGIIPPGNPNRAATDIDRLRAIGSARFHDFSHELQELTSIDNGYRHCGGIEFLQPEDEYVLPLWKEEGIAFEPLSHVRMKQLEPDLTGSNGQPYSLPGMAQVRNPWHLRALIAACERIGVKLHPQQRIQEFLTTGQRVTGVVLDSQRVVAAGRYLVAAGAWSSTLLPESLVHPVRGQIVLFHPGRPLLERVVMVGKHYLVPRSDGRILAGSTEEPEAGFEKANTSSAIAELREFAIELVPALADVAIEKAWSGLRPGTRDGLPFIGRISRWENAFIAAGHFRAGVQLSIGTAQLIAELFTGQPTCVHADAFRLDREPISDSKPAFRS